MKTKILSFTCSICILATIILVIDTISKPSATKQQEQEHLNTRASHTCTNIIDSLEFTRPLIDTSLYNIREKDEVLQIDNAGCHTADSVWVNKFDEIKLDKHNYYRKIYFKYNQTIDGFDVTMNWMQFSQHAETGHVIINFLNTKTGQSFQYINTDKYGNEVIDRIILKEPQDRNVYYLNYNESIHENKYQNSPIGYINLFQFMDVDFDGEKELLINNWDQNQDGNSYEVYEITANGLKLKDYMPFNEISNSVQFDFEKKKIILSSWSGIFDRCTVVFSKHQEVLTDKTIPKELSGKVVERILKEYYKTDKTDFRIDSIYQHVNQDSTYIFGLRNGELTLINAHKYNLKN